MLVYFKVGSGSKVEILLNKTSNTCLIYFNGRLQQDFPKMDDMEIFLHDDNKSIILTFSAGISLQVHILLRIIKIIKILYSEISNSL